MAGTKKPGLAGQKDCTAISRGYLPRLMGLAVFVALMLEEYAAIAKG